MSESITTAELLAQLRIDLDRINGEVETHFVPLQHDQLRWRPDPSEWSIGECLDHLCVVNEKVLAVLAPAITSAPPLTAERAKQPYKWGWMGKMFIKLAGPEVKTKAKAPKPFQPRATEVGAGIVEKYLRDQERIRALVDAADGRVLYDSKVPSPAFKLIRLKLGDYLAFVIAHEDRHVQQALRVMRHPGFPASPTE